MEVGGYDSPSASAACCLSAHQLQEGQSVFESGPLRSKQACVILPSSQPACLVAVLREGEKYTKIFRKTRKITSLGTSLRRNPSVPRAGAHRNGLRDVKEARTSPLLPPESRRLEAPFSDFLRKVLVFFGILRKVLVVSNIFRQKPWLFFILRKVFVQTERRVLEALPELQRRQISVP